MIRRSTHEATILLLLLLLFLLLLLLKGSSLLWLVVILILLSFASAFAMSLWLVHHVETGLTLRSFRSPIFSLSFLLNIKRGDQVQNRHVHPLVFESSGEIPL
jgi:peptidoglycan/LPS O-acetylase OafA/YrhL